MGECIAELTFDLVALYEFLLQGPVINGDASPTLLLGLVEGEISFAEEVERGRIVANVKGDAHRGSEAQLIFRPVDRFRELLDQAVSEFFGFVEALDTFGDDQELVAAEASDDVAGSGVGGQTGSDLVQDAIAAVMAAQVVGLFEVVEVDVQQRGVVRSSGGAGQGLFDRGDRGRSVEETGQRVVGGLVGKSISEVVLRFD